MMRILRNILIILAAMLSGFYAGRAQQPDTLHGRTAAMVKQGTAHPPAGPPEKKQASREEVPAFMSYQEFLGHITATNRFFTGTSKPVPDFDVARPQPPEDEWLFYTVFGILLLLAIIRLVFHKYFSDMFRAFFNPALSQRQLKEQLLQTPFPSLLLNIFFAVAGGFYFFLILKHYDYIVSYNPLYLVPAFILLVGAVYLVKYVFLIISGWLFGSSELIEGYVFVIYLINKVMGVILLPFIVVMAFCDEGVATISLYIAISAIMLLIVYRYIRAYGLVKNYIYFSRFHFFLYLCAFEIAPILIIGKLVLIWLNGNGG